MPRLCPGTRWGSSQRSPDTLVGAGGWLPPWVGNWLAFLKNVTPARRAVRHVLRPIPRTESGMISFFTLYFSLEDAWAKYKSALVSASREVLGPRICAKKPWVLQTTLCVIDQRTKAIQMADIEQYRAVHALSWTTPEIA